MYIYIYIYTRLPKKDCPCKTAVEGIFHTEPTPKNLVGYQRSQLHTNSSPRIVTHDVVCTQFHNM